MENNTFVIHLGGSIAFPEEINTDFIREFFLLIKKEIKKGKRFIIVIGGGRTARKYQKAAAAVTDVQDEDKDWLGIHATRLNAHLFRTVFKKEANPVVFDKRNRLKSFGGYPVIIGSGWRPGWSTDYVAIQIASDFKIKDVLILGKPDYVYTSNFETDVHAKPIEKMSWKEYSAMIPAEWTPGIHVPVDPVAARLAQKKKVKAIVTSGKDLINFANILNNEPFKGTVLE